jgi:predicted dehydrogenase
VDTSVGTGNSPVRIAIVGAGAITSSAHLPAALRSPLVELVALVDKDVDRLNTLKNKYDLHCVLKSDLADVIESVEAVLIATPPSTHFILAEFALRRGIATLIEKPMTLRYEDALTLCELAERSRTILTIGYYSRLQPAIKLMKHLLETNFFGKILGFELEHGTTGDWQPMSAYNLDRQQAGGGALMTNGTHFVDRLLYWFGEPARFTCLDDSYGGPEANSKVELYYNNDLGQFRGEVFISSSTSLRNRFILDAEQYRCEKKETQTQSLTLYPKLQPQLRFEIFPNVSLPNPEPDYFQLQLERFAKSVRGQSSVVVDGRGGARSVFLIEELYRHRKQLDEPWLLYRKKGNSRVEA